MTEYAQWQEVTPAPGPVPRVPDRRTWLQLVTSAPSDRFSLSDREMQVLVGMSQGLSDTEIGRQLYISADTVKTHNRRLYRKLGVTARAAAVAAACKHGLLPGMNPVAAVPAQPAVAASRSPVVRIGQLVTRRQVEMLAALAVTRAAGFLSPDEQQVYRARVAQTMAADLRTVGIPVEDVAVDAVVEGSPP